MCPYPERALVRTDSDNLLGERYLCTTQAAIWDHEENPSFLRILPMWFSTVRPEIESSCRYSARLAQRSSATLE